MPICSFCGLTTHSLIKECPNFSVYKQYRRQQSKSKKDILDFNNVCPHCKVTVSYNKLKNHISNKRPAVRNEQIMPNSNKNTVRLKNEQVNKLENSPRNLFSCPYCNVKVRQGRVQSHILKVHERQANKEQQTREKTIVAVDKNYTTTNSYTDWYECNSVDPIDGSKYLGYERREYQDSRFGSFPLHDDYGDESCPD